MSAFDVDPHNAFTVDDLADRIFPGIRRIEKKHRVTICRAIKTLVHRSHDFLAQHCGGCGGTLVIYRTHDLESYAMAQLKAEQSNYYRSHDRSSWSKPLQMAVLSPQEQEFKLRALILPGGEKYSEVQPGGSWWRSVRVACARRDGEDDVAEKLEAEAKRNTERLEKLLALHHGVRPLP